jgi:hypothetical protein
MILLKYLKQACWMQSMSIQPLGLDCCELGARRFASRSAKVISPCPQSIWNVQHRLLKDCSREKIPKDIIQGCKDRQVRNAYAFTVYHMLLQYSLVNYVEWWSSTFAYTHLKLQSSSYFQSFTFAVLQVQKFYKKTGRVTVRKLVLSLTAHYSQYKKIPHSTRTSRRNSISQK